jgi:uncharacterized HhH-GPD family protein
MAANARRASNTIKGRLKLSGDQAADKLISSNAFALMIGMVLDQQIPLEWAFTGPKLLTERLGAELDPKRIASIDEERLVELFSERPALHRFPGSMARRVHELAERIVTDYEGDTCAIWDGAETGQDLLRRLKQLPGFGEQKARIFVALLGKQLGVRPDGWEAAAGAFGESGSLRSIADITGPETLAAVRENKRAMKLAAAGSPGAAGGAGRGKAAAKKAAPARTKALAAKKAAPAKKVAAGAKKAAPAGRRATAR